MQIPKFLLMFCVATLGLSTLQAQRVDTEEQAKARELLRKKMAELDGQQPAAQPQNPSQPAPEPATPPKKSKNKKAAPEPAPAAASAPVVTPPPAVAATPELPATTPAPARGALGEGTTHLTPDVEAKAREELRRKMAELDPSESTPQVAKTAPAPKAPAKPAAARKKEKTVEPEVFATPAPAVPAASPVPAVGDSATSQTSAEPSTPQPSKPTAVRKTQKKTEQYIFDTPAPTAPVESPIPAAVPDSKSQKLAELLTRYRSNAITPEEYHKKRAEILAQP